MPYSVHLFYSNLKQKKTTTKQMKIIAQVSFYPFFSNCCGTLHLGLWRESKNKRMRVKSIQSSGRCYWVPPRKIMSAFVRNMESPTSGGCWENSTRRRRKERQNSPRSLLLWVVNCIHCCFLYICRMKNLYCWFFSQVCWKSPQHETYWGKNRWNSRIWTRHEVEGS